MELLVSLYQLEGRTIQSAISVDMDESIAMIFTDGTYVVFDVDIYGDSHDLILMDEVSDTIKKIAGIISEAEYRKIKCRECEQRRAQLREFEIQQLNMLREKYPNE